jgi:arylformamidase
VIHWHDLSHPFQIGMPTPDWPGEKDQSFRLDSFKIVATGGHQDFVCLNVHSGTHVDAPGHFVEGGESIDRVPFDRFVGTCLVVEAPSGPLERIGATAIARHVKRFAGTDMLFIRTGWDDRWASPEYGSHYPFLGEDCAQLLLDNGIKVLGLDTPSPDAPMRSGLRRGSPIHTMLLSNGVLIIENLANLRSLIDVRVKVYAIPLNIVGAYGAPARVVAHELIDDA